MATKPTTTKIPTVSVGSNSPYSSQVSNINTSIAKINAALAGGITGVTDSSTGKKVSGKVYFTPEGAKTSSGKVIAKPATGNTTGVTPNPKNTQAEEPGVISTEQGVSTLKQYETDKINDRSGRGTPESPLTDTQVQDLIDMGYQEGDTVPGKGRLHPGGYFVQDTTTTPPPTTTGVEQTTTYIDPTTGATETTTGPGSGSEEERAKYAERNMQVSERTAPAESTDTPEIAKLKAELANQEKEINSFKNRLLDLIITDADLRGDIRSITKAYDARIDEMRDINSRQIQGIKTLGYRMGAQYTGGMGGVWGGIISDAERQGVLKIAEIEGQKQSKILEAKAAARDNNFKIYAALMDDARELQKQKTAALADLVKEQKAQDAAIAARKKQVTTDAAIADLYAQGITDPTELMNFLNFDEKGNFIGDVTLEEVEKALKILNPPDALKGLDADYQTFNYLKKINDPSVAGLDWIDYQRIMANLKATASGANKLTAEERTNQIASSYARAFVPGATTTVIDKKTGQPVEINVLGPDNYLNPTVFNEAIVDAEIGGMPRTTFIERFGYLVNPAQTGLSETVTDENGNTYQLPYEQYVLSPEEYRMATGLEPENIGVLTRTGNEDFERTTKIGTAKTE